MAGIAIGGRFNADHYCKKFKLKVKEDENGDYSDVEEGREFETGITYHKQIKFVYLTTPIKVTEIKLACQEWHNEDSLRWDILRNDVVLTKTAIPDVNYRSNIILPPSKR